MYMYIISKYVDIREMLYKILYLSLFFIILITIILNFDFLNILIITEQTLNKKINLILNILRILK